MGHGPLSGDHAMQHFHPEIPVVSPLYSTNLFWETFSVGDSHPKQGSRLNAGVTDA